MIELAVTAVFVIVFLGVIVYHIGWMRGFNSCKKIDDQFFDRLFGRRGG